jgi:hypothetical protein
VLILEETDEFKWAVRLAAYNVIQADIKASQSQQGHG